MEFSGDIERKLDKHKGTVVMQMDRPIHNLPFKSHKLIIAMVQLEGPEPSGKIVAVSDDGRDRYMWKSMDEVNRRVDKSISVIDEICKQHLEPNVVVFPEYSIPLLQAVDPLQKKANEYDIVIVAGSDTVPVGKRSVFSQTAVIVPHSDEPIMIHKRHLSKWELEKGRVDTYEDLPRPLFKWKIEEQEYYLSIYQCLDFTFWPNDPPLRDQALIVLVPMCTPDLDTMHVYADTLLWQDGGRIVVLPNCVGGSFPGRSSVFAVTPLGKRLKPAIELPMDIECFAVFDINCDSMVTSLRTPQNPKSPLGKVVACGLDFSSHGTRVHLMDLQREQEESVSRAVVNPALFNHCDRTLGITFFSIESYGELKDEDIRRLGFECYAVLGHSDIITTHLYSHDTDLVFDILKTMPWRIPAMEKVAESDVKEIESFPYFKVRTFHKVLGVRVPSKDINTFNINPPTDDEIAKILTLAKNWNTEEVSNSERADFRAKRWILGRSDIIPGEINAIMTIFLDHPKNGRQPMDDFNRRVMPTLVQNHRVTSIFEGESHKMYVHYVLRITTSVESLFSLIEEIHTLATKEKLILRTNTYVVVKKWSDLDLVKALSRRGLPKADHNYLMEHILPVFTEDDRDYLAGLPSEDQAEFIERLRYLDTNCKSLKQQSWLSERLTDFNRELTRGMFHLDFGILKIPHDMLQSRVETIIREEIKNRLEENQLDELRESLNISKGKTLGTLTYTERLKVMSRVVAESAGYAQDLKNSIADLYENTVVVRNALNHTDWEKLSIDMYIKAILSYTEFLRVWNKANK
ncbi:hypothetical protein KKB28_05460 [bacterium]|nr:hypothetical protein [bacterium]